MKKDGKAKNPDDYINRFFQIWTILRILNKSKIASEPEMTKNNEYQNSKFHMQSWNVIGISKIAIDTKAKM